MALLVIDNLRTYYQSEEGWVRAVDDVSLELDQGESLGLVGESGCGKTSLGLSVLRLLPVRAKTLSGRIMFDNENLLELSEEDMRKIRWSKISMIFQSAMNALNPVQKIRDQLAEAPLIHSDMSRMDARKKAREMLELVGIPVSREESYPHQLSGGMRQRAIIAMSLICGPKLIIADEPTTALDVIVQDHILQEIKKLQVNLRIAMIIISHDLSVVAETCQKIAIMYGGKMFEVADTASMFRCPRNPYTVAILRSFPSIRGPRKELACLSGNPPSLLNPPPGCRFSPRCPIATDICKNVEPPLVEIEKGKHYSRCHYALESRLERVLST